MERTGLIRLIMLSLILSGYVGLASAQDTSKFQWREGTSGRLLRNEQISYMGYSAVVTAFPSPVESGKYDEKPIDPVNPFVGLNISKDGIFIKTIILGPGESFILPDGDLKVTAEQLPSQDASEWVFESYEPWVVLSLQPRGTPNLETSVRTEADEYVSSPATEITAIITIRNSGSADAFNVGMNINSELQVKKGNQRYQYETIKKDESITETITFSAPSFIGRKNFDISVNISGHDAKDIQYEAKDSHTVMIMPEPQQLPVFRKTTNSKIYLKDYAMVSLSLKNNANYALKNVSITDYLSESFRLVDNISLHWVVDIPANAEWDYHYLIKPQEAGKDSMVLPSATAEFLNKNEYYAVQSDRPEILVYGPRIVLTKQTDATEIRPGDRVTVTVTAENNGITPTKVFINDRLPQGVTLVAGKTSYEEFLEADKKVSFSYTLSLNSQNPVRLPAARAEYFELGTKGEKRGTISQEVEI
ncbi:MAG TPA: hypothetical protein VIO11_06315, partial [Candidatus Methanoperedens sp.]